ncbi:uncharacterized protein LOC116249964 [Nymphaea colorata]|nr:uncharacterized protein LOC116249964 [Nymphaea colorata]
MKALNEDSGSKELPNQIRSCQVDDSYSSLSYDSLTFGSSVCIFSRVLRSGQALIVIPNSAKTGKPAVDFGIHGLWPNYNDVGYPSHCDNGSPFLPSEISDLRDEMEKQWPSLSCPSSDGTSFWSHEWERHGACSESVLDQHQYFQAALNLKTQLNLLHILTKAGKGWLSPYCQRSRAAAAGSDSNLCIRKHNFAAGPRKITSMSLGSKKIHAPYCTQISLQDHQLEKTT